MRASLMLSADLPLRLRSRLLGGVCAAFAILSTVVFGLATVTRAAQVAPETIGRIEGDDLAVKNPISMEASSGRTAAVLGTGSDVTVRSGKAVLALDDGGEVGICGPAHFSVLKTKNVITVALDYGRVEAQPSAGVTVIVYTPLVVATPVAVGDEPRDFTVGLEHSGAMCILAAHGAVRIEHQLSGQSLLVPQGGQIELVDSELASARGVTGGCECDAIVSRRSPPPKPVELSSVGVPEPPPVPVPKAPEKTLAEAPKPPDVPPDPPKADVPPIMVRGPVVPSAQGQPPAHEEPIYQVFMPPLQFDAKAAGAQPEPDPRAIVLLRAVRVRPALVYHGHVAATRAQATTPKSTAVVAAATPTPPAANSGSGVAAQTGMFTRMWDAVRRTFSKNP